MGEPQQVTRGVHRLGSSLVSWYLVEEGDRLTAVDAGLPAFARDLERQLAQIDRRPGDVEAVILSHPDADHTGVAPRLRDAGARVLIHSEDDASLRKPGHKGGDASRRHLITQLSKPAFWRFVGGKARAGSMSPAAIDGAENFAHGDRLDVPGSPEGPQPMPKVTNVDDERARISLAAMEELEADVILPGHGDPWHGSPAAAMRRARAAR